MRNSLIFILFLFYKMAFPVIIDTPFPQMESSNYFILEWFPLVMKMATCWWKNPGTILYIAVSYLQGFELHMDKITQMIDRNKTWKKIVSRTICSCKMAAMEVLPCSRNRTETLLRGESLSRQFHSLFRQAEDQPAKYVNVFWFQFRSILVRDILENF